MTKRYPSFRSIKSQGSKGDQGNDGFIPEQGAYYQVYAPEEPKTKIAEAIKKAQDDFRKLKISWDPTQLIQRYYFVFNDKFKGAYPEIEHTLAKIKEDNELEDATPFYAQHLQSVFLELPDDDKVEILGTVIPASERIQQIDFPLLTEILQHLVDHRKPISVTSTLKVPDFSKKILFNGISEGVGRLLTHGSYQQGLLEEYFSRVPDFNRSDIRDRLKSIYEDRSSDLSSAALPNGLSCGDMVFFDMLGELVPRQEPTVQDAAIALISYFFEQCDVFKDPNS